VARRPAGNRRQAGHTSYPYLKQKPVEIRDAICVGIGAWMKKA
jgi:hypothetical protein